MVNQPIKLQDKLYLYSGDVITINGSSPLLVEIVSTDKQTIKLRNIKDNKYLKEKNISLRSKLKFSADFENSLIFTVKKNSESKISLQTDKDKYLKLKDKEFRLSSKERWLDPAKQQNTENIANFEEIIESVEFDRGKEEKNGNKELLIAYRFYNNKNCNPLPINCSFTESKQREQSFTFSADFTLGASVNLKLSCPSISGIDIGGKFETKSGTSNTIKKTDTITIQESINPTCSPWKKMRIELRAKSINSSIPYTATVKRIIGGNTYEYLIDGSYSYNNYFDSYCSSEEITVRNILIVGWTGSGKSTLANVLSDENEFKEGDESIPKTKWCKLSKEFEHEGNHYCVIDNIGFGDTEVSERDVLIRIGEAINSAYQGLSHVLYVFSERFSDKEKESFCKLAALKITNHYITLVRSHFPNFLNEEACNGDESALKKEGEEIKRLLNSCRGLLHIDNVDEDSREDSRKKVLKFLNNNCPKVFKSKEWEDITSLIDKYFVEKEKLENGKKQADADQKAIEQQIDKLKTDTADQVKQKAQEEEILQGLIEVVKETVRI